MSTFTDGSGQEGSSDGTARPGWRDLERIVAAWLGGSAPQNKGIFDVIVESPGKPEELYGISVKSKKLSKRGFKDLLNGGRVYMELCNSPAKLWEPLSALGIGESDFRKERRASEIGNSILATVHDWYENSKITNLNVAKSAHLAISYFTKPGVIPIFQLHSFDLGFPKGVEWRYKSDRCLSGFDPTAPDEVLFDWYALSGGQLKFYPSTAQARFSSPQFPLISLSSCTIDEKARSMWSKDECWSEGS